jgi:epsilon-lactone hydrolase
VSAEQLANLIQLLTSRPAPADETLPERRERFEKLGSFLPTPADARAEPVEAGGVKSEVVSAPGVNDLKNVLYLHGGGYVVGSINTHRTLAYNLSKASGARVLLIDYRLAPENPFPAAVDDALAAYRWLLDGGADPAHLAVAGDSAGGGLAVALMVALKDAGLPQPGCAVCMSPWVDMEAIGDSMTGKAKEDPMVQREAILGMATAYLGDADTRSPLAAPLYADLSGLAPMLIQVGTAETLLDDSVRLAAVAKAVGVQVTLDIAEDMIHVWQLFAPMLSEGGEAIDRAGDFINQHIG